MGAGVGVGRVGGLAVALGIGAAVFTGHGVASAEPSEGSDSSSTSSSTGSSGSSATTSSDDAPESKQTSEAETPDASTESRTSDETPPNTTRTRKNNRSSDTTPSRRRVERPDVSTEPTRPTTAHKPDESPVEDVAPTANVELSAVAETADVTVPDTTVQRSAAQTVTQPDPGDPVTVAIESVVRTIFSPLADTAPTAPVDSPAEWTLLAAARRDFGTERTLDTGVGEVTTNSLATDVTDTPVATLAQSAASVVAFEQTPLLAPLQQVPVVGPLFVTPVVAFIKQIPFIGDILHPIIGYPLGLTGGTMPRDVKVISFDGTPIYVHFFPAVGLQPGQTAPTILNGPGLSLPGETNPTAEDNPFLPNQVIGMAPLLRNGYNVITWDPRGEWSSGGQLQIDSPDFEGRDVSAIISWLSQQPEARLDAPGDPRLGMVGASYGGGIQLVTAAIDQRVDAIVPTIAWHSLNTSLYKNEAFKSSWGTLLTAALVGTFARTNPQIYPAAIYGLLTSTLTPAQQDLLAERGPGDLVNNITAPTLLIQGTVDTLFTLQEAHENAIALIGNGVPTKVVWYCGGHGACIYSTNDGEVIERATLQWLDRYVNGDLSVSTGPQFEWVDQHGQQFSSDVYPVKQGPQLVASSDAGGVLPLLPFLGGSGPQFRAFEAGLIGGLLGILSGAKAINAVNLTVPAAATTRYIVGAPQLTFTYSGTGVARHVYAQLVDDTTGLVLGNLVTPVPVILDGQTHTVTIPMEMVAHTLRPGETVTLQLVASAVSYQAIWSLGTLTVSSMQIALPTADAGAISSSTAAELASAA